MRPGQRPDAADDDLTRTFDLFSGVRAASENLQLERIIEPTEEDREAAVDLADVAGITIAPVDWEPLIADADPQPDPLAAYIPDDQFAVFFGGPGDLARVLDEVEQLGTRLVQWADRHEDAGAQQRYEQQLGATVAMLALAEPAGVRSMAVTAGDPYLVAGTDLAIVMEADDPDALADMLREHHARVADRRGVALQERAIGKGDDAVTASVLRTPDREVSAYLAVLAENVAVLSNSPVQLERIVAAKQGERGSLLDLDEYTYFRDRYRLGEPETAWLVVTDDAIRKWGSPAWRIAASRRARMYAAMQQAKADHFHAMLAGDVEPRELDRPLPVPGAGALRLTDAGIVSEVYGRPEFLTPINELEITHASEPEAEAYRRWRAQYEGRWREYFCPIALRLHLEDERVAGDITVLPLIERSVYRDWLEIVGEANVEHAGPMRPRHARALRHGHRHRQPDDGRAASDGPDDAAGPRQPVRVAGRDGGCVRRG